MTELKQRDTSVRLRWVIPAVLIALAGAGLYVWFGVLDPADAPSIWWPVAGVLVTVAGIAAVRSPRKMDTSWADVFVLVALGIAGLTPLAAQFFKGQWFPPLENERLITAAGILLVAGLAILGASSIGRYVRWPGKQPGRHVKKTK